MITTSQRWSVDSLIALGVLCYVFAQRVRAGKMEGT